MGLQWSPCFLPKDAMSSCRTETDTIGEPGGPGCAGTIVSLGIQPIRKIFRLFSMMERTLTGSVGFLTQLVFEIFESMLNEKSETNIPHQHVASMPDQVCNPTARRSHTLCF